MKWNKTKMLSIAASVVLAGELTLLLDAVLVLNEKPLSIPKVAAMYGAMLLLTLLPVFKGKRKAVLAAGIAVVAAIPMTVIFLCWYGVSQSVVYVPVDDTKAQLYGDQRVMLIVPHEDDDYNVLGGVMEEYVKYGSEVYVVFSSNGDYYVSAEVRHQEAVQALGRVGIPADHIIFLGYGDGCMPEGPHIYNGEPNQVIPSPVGRLETYGTQIHNAYREGRAYTVNNFLEDIEDVILEYLPEVIFCVDYDHHIDHRALSLGFEKVMGKILRTQRDYRPLVFKGYAYKSAWEAEGDFYGENILATQNVYEISPPSTPQVLRWEDRTRLPVQGESLSRSLLSAKGYGVISTYFTQEAPVNAAHILNGDKVFWQRQTESLCYGATVTASSSDPELLHDFMLLESRDLVKNGDLPYDGVWIPAETDREKQVQVAFSEPQYIDTIVLYDHPDKANNVRNARIAFDDGTMLETGPLDPGGGASEFRVEKTEVTSFTVTLLETEGQAGLTEIEAFGADRATLPDYGKLMDEDGNFAYDYWIDPSGEQDFILYTNGWSPEKVTCSVDNPDCTVTRTEGKIRVICPTGERCTVSVLGEDGEALDRVMIRNPGAMERSWKQFWLRAEKIWTDLCESKLLEYRLIVFRVYKKLPGLLNRIF